MIRDIAIVATIRDYNQTATPSRCADNGAGASEGAPAAHMILPLDQRLRLLKYRIIREEIAKIIIIIIIIAKYRVVPVYTL